MAAASFVAEVKRLLRVSHASGDETALRSAYGVLKATAASDDANADPTPTELFILCCEEAIAHGVWPVAVECVRYFTGQLTATQTLLARSLYCGGLVQCHELPADLRGDEMVEARQECAALVLKGLALAVDEWPRDVWVVVDGVRSLWDIIEPLFRSGYYRSVVDMIAFVAALHERLMIGGPHTQLEWVMRYATCLRNMGNHAEALALLTQCTETAQRLNNDRLQVQLLRVTALVTAEHSVLSGKAKVDAPSAARPVITQAVLTTQVFMCGGPSSLSSSGATGNAVAELLGIYDRMTGSSSTTAVAVTVAEKDGAASSKSRGKPSKMSIVENAIADPEMVEEVLSDVVLCLTLCGEGERCASTISKLLASPNMRAKTFAAYAKTLGFAHHTGLIDLLSAPDASRLNADTANGLLKCIREVESAMDSARMIVDVSERQYCMLVGCVLLWNYSLALMQDSTHAQLRHTFDRITRELEESSAASASLVSFRVRAEYESSVADFNEDNLSRVSARIDRALSRGYTATYSDGSVYFPMDYPLLWLRHRTDIRTKPEASCLPAAEDQVLFSVEQAKVINSASKRLLLLKAAFNKLPPLEPEVPPTPTGASVSQQVHARAAIATGAAATGVGGGDPDAASSTPRRAATSVAPGARREMERRKSRVTAAAATTASRPPKASLATLYFTVLKECQRSMAPSLIPIAATIAQALCGMEVPLDERHVDLLLMKTEAHLAISELLIAEEEEGGRHGAEEYTTSPGERSVRIVDALKQACELSAALSDLRYPNAWITINACQVLLQWRGPAFAAGRFAEYLHELTTFYNYFIRLDVDHRREARLTVDLGLLYVLALLQEYTRVKGEATGEAATPASYDGFVSRVMAYPKSEANNALLKAAHEACGEVMNRVPSPAATMQVLLLYPCVCRLLNTRLDSPPNPQVQLLLLLGRMAGPVSLEESKSWLDKDAMELLSADPSVQLCGLVAGTAVRMGNERVALAACALAEHLYGEGKLGWTTVSNSSAGSGNVGTIAALPANALSTVATAASPNRDGEAGEVVAEKPGPLDWLAFARTLLCQASVYNQRRQGIDLGSGEKLGLRVLTLCTNCAIAASHAPLEARYALVSSAILLYATVVAQLWSNACAPHLLTPSLKMLLSQHIVSCLQLSLSSSNITSSNHTNTGNGTRSLRSRQRVVEALSSIGDLLLRCCAATGAAHEGMESLRRLMAVLPVRLHRGFKVAEMQFRCELGLSTEALLRKTSSDDPDTAALVWMALARHTRDASESASAWKQALVVAKGQATTKATVLLGMAQHLSEEQRISTRDARVLLLSALDLVEDTEQARGGAAVGQLVDQLAARRAQFFPSRLVATLTGRSLVASVDPGLLNAEKTVGSLGKSIAAPATLTDLMLAARLVYLLFCLAPTNPTDTTPEQLHLLGTTTATTQHNHPRSRPDSAAGDAANLSKRDYAVLLVHYIDCMWRLAASTIEGAEQTAPPLSLPADLNGWFGFFHDPDHVIALRHATTALDSRHNTEAMQAVYLEVADYLMHARLEQYVFLTLSWAHFTACWRYGSADCRATAVQRAVYQQMQFAGARCGCGRLCHVYTAPPVIPQYWAALRAGLAGARPVGSAASLPSLLSTEQTGSPATHLSRSRTPGVAYSRYVGTLHDVLVREAVALERSGRVEEAVRIADAVLPTAVRLGDADAVARCHLVRSVQLEVHKRADAALAHMRAAEGGSGVLEGTSPRVWLEWKKRIVVLLLRLSKVEEAYTTCKATRAGLSALSRESPADTITGDVLADTAATLADVFERFLVKTFLFGEVRACADGPGRRLLDSALDALWQPHASLESRLTALMAQRWFSGDVTAAWATASPSVDAVREAMDILTMECSRICELETELHAEAHSLAACTMSTAEVHARPRCYTLLSRLLRVRGENTMEKLRVIECVRRLYRAQTLEELHIPGGGPAELERNVLQFMRDPGGGDGGDGSVANWDQLSVQAEWLRPMDGLCTETRNAFLHFRLPVEPITRIPVGRFNVRAALQASREAAGHQSGAAYDDAVMALARVDLQYAVESGMGGRFPIDTCAQAAQAFLDERWEAAPLTTVERPAGGRRSGYGDRLRAARAGKDAATADAVDANGKELSEDEGWVLEALVELAKESHRVFAYERATECYTLLSHFFVIWGRPHAAGCAVEFALASKLFALLTTSCMGAMANTAEGRLWRSLHHLQLSAPDLAHSSVLSQPREALLAASAMLQRFDVGGEWAKVASALHPQEAVSLTLLVDGGFLYVALRHPDGSVDTRRKPFDVAAVARLVTDMEAFAESRAHAALGVQQGAASALATAAKESTRVALEEMAPLLSRLEALLLPHLQDFEGALQCLCVKLPLVLSADPLLQSLPLEQMDIFSLVHVIQRELGAPTAGRKAPTRAATGKSSSLVLCVVDPFGENTAAVETLFGSEPKSKVGQPHVLTAVNGALAFSTEYLMWELESVAYGAVLFNLCGRISSILPHYALAGAKLDHLQSVALIADAVNEASVRREERVRLTTTSAEREQRWLVPLLFLARGARSVSSSCLPVIPAVNDALCKRAIPVISGGRSLAELNGGVSTKGKEMKKELIVLYGAGLGATKGKEARPH